MGWYASRARGKTSSLRYNPLLNKAVYNKAKHTVERLDWHSHLFSVADAIAVYLECRVIGARLLRNSDVTTTHGEPVF